MKTYEFDKKFDDGELDIIDELDLTTARRVNKANNLNTEQKRVNVDFPVWMVESLDKEAKILGVSRQSVIKFWISERLSSKLSAH